MRWMLEVIANDRPTMLAILTYLLLLVLLGHQLLWWLGLFLSGFVFGIVFFVENRFREAYPVLFDIRLQRPQLQLPLLTLIHSWQPSRAESNGQGINSHANKSSLPSVACIDAKLNLKSSCYKNEVRHHGILQLSLVKTEEIDDELALDESTDSKNQSSEFLLFSEPESPFDSYYDALCHGLRRHGWQVLRTFFDDQERRQARGASSRLNFNDVHDASRSSLLTVIIKKISQLDLSGLENSDQMDQILKEHVKNVVFPEMETIVQNVLLDATGNVDMQLNQQESRDGDELIADGSESLDLSGLGSPFNVVPLERKETNGDEDDVDDIVANRESHQDIAENLDLTEPVSRGQPRGDERISEPITEEGNDSPSLAEESPLTVSNLPASSLPDDPFVQEIQSYIREALTIIQEVDVLPTPHDTETKILTD